jgi:hypothetical protein
MLHGPGLWFGLRELAPAFSDYASSAGSALGCEGTACGRLRAGQASFYTKAVPQTRDRSPNASRSRCRVAIEFSERRRVDYQAGDDA